MLAGQGPEGEQALLYGLQGARVQIHRVPGLFEERHGLGALGRGANQGRDNIVQASLGLAGRPLHVPEGGLEGRLDACPKTEFRRRLVHGVEQFLAVHQQGPVGGERGFLPRLRGEPLQFVYGVAQVFLVPACRFQVKGRLGPGDGRPAPDPPGLSDPLYPGVQVPVGIQKGTVVGRVEQTLTLELAVQLDARLADAPE